MYGNVDLVWVFVVDYTKGWGIREHSHDYFQMYYCLAGGSPICLGEQNFCLRPNDCLLIRPNQVHELKPISNGYLRIVDTKFYIHDESLYRALSEMPPLINIVSPVFHRLQQETRNEWASSAAYNSEMASLLFEQSLYLYLREMAHTSTKVPFYDAMEQKTAKLTGLQREIVDYLLESLWEEISLDQMARDLRYSKNYLCKIFKDATGYTIIEYRNFLRIRKAYDIVRSTNQALSDISVSCGFSSIHYFSRLFRKYVGIPPSQVRDQDRNMLNIDMQSHAKFQYRYYSSEP